MCGNYVEFRARLELEPSCVSFLNICTVKEMYSEDSGHYIKTTLNIFVGMSTFTHFVEGKNLLLLV